METSGLLLAATARSGARSAAVLGGCAKRVIETAGCSDLVDLHALLRGLQHDEKAHGLAFWASDRLEVC